ncbi:hypothetical protein U5640_36615 [Streptomyces sp. SS7]|uniref:hypothetical protein n=1 Tax=Streptomyces sp. SS7 TaxID=3108485 RepID=UPI0030ED10C1
MREQRGQDVVRLVLGLFNDRVHRVDSPAAGLGELQAGRSVRGDDLRLGRVPASSVSASARQTEATEGCCPAFSPVLRISFFAISGTPSSFTARATVTGRRG